MTTVTVKSSGGDYTTLQDAINACPSNITAAGTNETWEIECYASVTGTQDVSVSGKTTDETHYIRIYTPTAERHNGISGGFEISQSAFGYGITSDVLDLRVEGIRFHSSGNGSIHLNAAATRRLTVSECLFLDARTYGSIRIQSVTGGYLKVKNCVRRVGAVDPLFIYTQSGSGFTVYTYNCTGYSTYTSASGMYNHQASSITWIAKNCLGVVAGSSTAFYTAGGASFSGSSSHNNSSDSSAPGTSATTSWTHNFVDAANGDFNLSSEVAGTNLSADANFPFSNDIEGNTRSGWSRGAFEFAPAGSGGKPVNYYWNMA